jgi:hypothetical protein
MECDYRRVLSWWPDLLNSLIQRMTTHTQRPETRHHCRYLVAPSVADIFFPLWVPELFPASAISFLQQQLTETEPQQFSDLKAKSKLCYDRRSVGQSWR